MTFVQGTASARSGISKGVARGRVHARGRAAGFQEPFLVIVPWMLLVFVVTFRPQEIWPSLEGLRLAKMTKLALLGALILSGMAWRWRAPQFYAYAGIVAAIALSTPFSYWPGGSAKAVITGIRELIVFVVAISAVRSLKLIRYSLWLWLASYTVSCVWALITQGHRARIGGIASDSAGTSDFGIILTMCIGIAIGLMPYYRRFLHRAVLVAVMGICAWGLIRTGSRGSFLGFICMIGFWIFSSTRGMVRRFGIAAAVLTFGIVLVLPTGRLSRQMTIFNWQEEFNAQMRMDLNIAAVKMFVDYPLTGIGCGCYPLAWFEYRPQKYNEDSGYGRRWMCCHNMFLTALAETGLVGFVSIIALYGCTFRGLSRVTGGKGQAAIPLQARCLANAMRLGLVGGCSGAMFLLACTVPFSLLIILAVSLCQAMPPDKKGRSLAMRKGAAIPHGRPALARGSGVRSSRGQFETPVR